VTRPAPPPVDAPRGRSSPLRWVGLGAAGAGVIALGVGTVFGLSAKSTWDDAKAAGCDDDGVCPNRASADLVDDARSKATLSTITVVTGVGLVAGGVLLYLFAPRERAAVAPVVGVLPGGAAIGFGGSF
jgi:hypothetical protein